MSALIPFPGARECLERMDDLGYSYRFVSNSTRRCRESVAERLAGLGYDIPARLIFTPPLAAIEHMKSREKESCYLLTTIDVLRDFLQAGIRIVEDGADYVIVGDAAEGFTYEKLNCASAFSSMERICWHWRWTGTGSSHRDCLSLLAPSWPLWSMPRERRQS